MKCPYYPLYCKVLGHVSCANKCCDMKKASKEERAVALKEITKVAVDAEVIRNRGELCFCCCDGIDFSFVFFLSKLVFYTVICTYRK